MSRLIPVALICGVLSGGWFVTRNLMFRPDDGDTSETESPTETAAHAELVLPRAKLAKANFTTEPVLVRQIEQVQTVPGRIGYDEAHHIEVKAPVSGIVVQMSVTPGDRVEKGSVLAKISSPEIGSARADAWKAKAAVELVQQKVDRLKQINGNLKALFQRLDHHDPLEQIEQEFDAKSLGSYREEILAAYSQKLYADRLYQAAEPLAQTGGIAMKTIRERDNNRHIAHLRFRTVRESVAFDTQVEQQTLAAELADARRRQSIARDHLQTLLGYSEDIDPVAGQSLSVMEVRAPFAGTIESRTLAASERVSQSDPLFVLANTDSLYVSADVRENEWAALRVQSGTALTVMAPAIPDRSFQATVHYVGREVATGSNSVPVVARIDNSEGLLRPGMFVRVSIPTSRSNDVLTVRQRSVVQHEQEQFVFVAMSDNTFRRVNVETGDSNPEWVEVRTGLQSGDAVVADGAFLLKSELLLAGEEE